MTSTGSGRICSGQRSRTATRLCRVKIRQRGYTLVELMVALLLSGSIAVAAISSLLVARRGFSAVDASAQLKDNARFASELLQRVVSQAGFLGVTDAVNVRTASVAVNGVSDPPPYTFGFNNAVLTTTAAPLPTDVAMNGNRSASTGGCASTTDTACVNGSDILVLRYQTPAASPGGTVGDKTTINCAGVSQTASSAGLNDLAVSVFHVGVKNDEPALLCSFQSADGTWQAAPVVLVDGVESFQVLYGMDNVTPANASPGTLRDLVSDQYLRADQIAAVGTAQQIADKWRRVRSVRIGMVLRAAPNSAQNAGAGLVYYPLGPAMVPAIATDDPGARFAPPADGRLRQTLTFTVFLRNDQVL